MITFMPKTKLILQLPKMKFPKAEIMLGLAPPFQATSCIPSFEATNIIILYISILLLSYRPYFFSYFRAQISFQLRK